MQVEKLVEIIQAEKKCSAAEALQVVELLGMEGGDNKIDPDGLKKQVFDLWETQFGKSSRNFGLPLDAFQSLVDRLRTGDQTLFEHVFLKHFSDCMNFLIYQKKVPHHIAYDVISGQRTTPRQNHCYNGWRMILIPGMPTGRKYF